VRVLVVDDDEKISRSLRRGLEAEGFRVDLARDGDDGLWMASEGRYDAILLDVMLPGRDGHQVCRELRAAGNWTPILALTARVRERDQTAALERGADDYLAKPFSFPVLVARIHALTRRAATRDPSPVQAGDLTIDPRQRRAWRAGNQIMLSARQFEVLEFLMRRAGRVLSKDDILAGVWGFDFEGDPNVVEVYVRRLRRQIDEPFGRRAIETLRGVGYRLSPDGG
jgi:DNA-binding response OmpR family regulator